MWIKQKAATYLRGLGMFTRIILTNSKTGKTFMTRLAGFFYGIINPAEMVVQPVDYSTLARATGYPGFTLHAYADGILALDYSQYP